MNTEDKFLGYCKYQIEEIHEQWWASGNGVAYVKPQESEDDFLQMPLVRQFVRLLELCKDGIKLTPSGLLPNKVVAEVYPLGPEDWYIESGKVSLGKHCNCYTLCQTFEIFLKTGFVKKRKGVLSLTKKGKEYLNSPGGVFFELLTGMATDNDPYILDAYEMIPFNNMAQFLCALLEKYGKEFRPVEEYAWAYAACNPKLAHYLREDRPEQEQRSAVNAFCARMINRYLEWLGLVEFKHRRYGPENTLINPDLVKTTELFDKFIGINPPVTAEQYAEEVGRDCIKLAGSKAKEFFEWMGLDTEDFPEELLNDCEASPDDEEIFNWFINPSQRGKYLS